MLAVALLQIVPHWLVTYVPLTDYPSHLSRAFIAETLSVNALFQQYYSFVFTLNPNSAVDLILPPLLHLFNPLIAGKIFLTGIILLYMLGCHMLSRQIKGRMSYSAVLASCTAMNWMYLYGFINYAMGLGLVMIGFTCWLRWRTKWTFLRMLTLSALAFACYLSHLSAFGFLVISIVTASWVDWSDQKLKFRALALAVIGAVVLILLLIFWPSLIPGYYWGTPMAKIVGLTGVLRTYDRLFDMGFVLAMVALTVVLYRKRNDTRWARPLVACSVALLLCYLITPAAYGTLGGVDVRAVPLILVYAILGIEIEAPQRFVYGCFVAAIALMALRMTILTVRWMDFDSTTKAQVEMLDKVPSGATLYPVSYEDVNLRNAKDRTLSHVVCFSTIRRGVIVGDFWHNLVIERVPLPKPKFDSHLVPSGPSIDSLTAAYDYLWCNKPTPAFRQALTQRAEVVAEADSVLLLRSLHQSIN
jgi:hypothetical protein